MTSLTLVLLVDAFRRDYASRTTFIGRLAAEGRTGALREDFGFTPRAGYFGGLGPDESGFTNMYCCDPARSPFGQARGVPSSRFGREVEDQFGIRTWLEAEARRRTTSYAASYLTTAEIPLDLLPWFDVAEKYGPADRRVGYRTILHDLEDRGWPFFTCMWPESNRLDDHSDDGIVRHALTRVHPPCRFAFVHLQALDGLGHFHGPESRELLDGLDRTDRLVETLVGELRRRFDRIDIVLFGDHGMVPVTGTIDVWKAVADSGASIGRDVVPFLDSTMARFWFPVGVSRTRVIEALRSLRGGRILESNDLDRLGLSGCDSRNGELYFLADPGILIVPNFFHRRGALPVGMHGYEPDCPDNQGIFLVHGDGTPAGDAGIVSGSAVHHESRRLLALASWSRPIAASASARRLSGTLTQHRDPIAQRTIRAHMARIVDEVTTLVPDAEAIVLGGSFGRDEGAVTCDPDGTFRPLNDYDVLVLTPDGTAAARLEALGHDLARDFDIDFVQLGAIGAFDPAAPPTLANFDWRYGSRVIWGNPAAIDSLPRYVANDIPPIESVQLLCNRLGGLLSGVRADGPLAIDRRRDRYFINQVMKALTALGDWRLLRSHAYDASYARRLERFSWLAPGFGVSFDERTAIEEAYRFKLHPDDVQVDHLSSLRRDVLRWLVSSIMSAIEDLSRRRVVTPSDAASAYCLSFTADDGAIAMDNARAARLFAGDGSVDVRPHSHRWVRREIYASLPLVAAASDGDAVAFADAGARLDACLSPPWPATLTTDNWEFVRERLTRAWLTLVH